MIAHLPIVMVALPMFTGAILLWLGTRPVDAATALARQRAFGRASLLAMLPLAAWMLGLTEQGQVLIVRIGNWPSPFAIVLAVDRLSALMVSLTVVLAFFVQWAARDGVDERGQFFHPLLQFQVMGLCGAFMTGDLFNLFVFFEILLIASYALLLFGRGRARLRAGLHFVILNLIGSALFLLGVGVIYGLLGTLNLADLAQKASLVSEADAPLLHAGALLLLLVFGLKAAIVPVHLWLPATYHAPFGPVSALFAIMTKVGVYSIIRVFIPIFGPGQGWASEVAEPWVLPLGLLTLVAGGLGVLAAADLKKMLTYLVVTSVGTQVTAVGLFTEAGLSAATFYITHSTLLTAGFFLLAEGIIERRGDAGGRLSAGPLVRQARPLAAMYLFAAMSTVGLPPLTGFIGKVLILVAVPEAWRGVVWTVVLITSFALLVQLARIGSVLFWNLSGADAEAEAESEPARPRGGSLAPAAGLLSLTLVLTVFAERVDVFARATAAQIYDRQAYVERVMLDADPQPKTKPNTKPKTKPNTKQGGAR